jgi:predicted RNA-binding Zn ribbon-like protein
MANQISEIPDGLSEAFETVLQFVNTRTYEPYGFFERFGNAPDFSDWARQLGLLGDEPVSESEAAAARELRSALLAVMMAHSNHPHLTASQIDSAERHLAHAGQLYPVKITLTTQTTAATGFGSGAAGVMGTVLAAAHEVARNNSWHRLKVCTCDPCENGFADRTKSGRQQYCGPTCSSRSAMRARRKRLKEAATQ